MHRPCVLHNFTHFGGEELFKSRDKQKEMKESEKERARERGQERHHKTIMILKIKETNKIQLWTTE